VRLTILFWFCSGKFFYLWLERTLERQAL